MSNIVNLIGLTIGIFGFLFFFWKRTKEDYSSNEIFSFAFTLLGSILLGSLLGYFISSRFSLKSSVFNLSGLWFWGGFIFGCLGFSLAYFKFKLRFFETLEAGTVGFLFFYLSILLSFSLQVTDIKLLLFVALQALLISLFFFLDSRYKSFSWYKSGKIGFTGLTILGIFFLMRAIVALLDPSMLSFVGKVDAIVDSLVAFAFFITLFNLSGN